MRDFSLLEETLKAKKGGFDFWRLERENDREEWWDLPIVCLCGSTRFEDVFHEKEEEFALKGYIVLTPNCWSKKQTLSDPKTPDDKETKKDLDLLHKAKIMLADLVFVINKDGYIGPSTRSEIEFAETGHVPIAYLEPVKAGA